MENHKGNGYMIKVRQYHNNIQARYGDRARIPQFFVPMTFQSSLFSARMICHGPNKSTSPYAGGNTRTIRPVAQSTYHRLPLEIT